METENYQPYGEEWKDELMKLPKIMIINMYRNACLELEEARQLCEQATNAASQYEERARDAEREIRDMERSSRHGYLDTGLF